ncbi:MAG: mannose-1-phosphate guanylyltransferase/mannose-6-phosphate isomerase [Ectothiorhodospiraceae bacterium]
MSRRHYPKQFLAVNGENTMLQAAAERAGGLREIGPPIVLANEQHRFLVAQQLTEAGVEDASIVLEPVGRNTAPAVALAALYALRSDPEAVLLVMPSDHLIADDDAFRRAVEAGREAAHAGRLVTFGVVPTGPETGYGYVRAGEALENGVRVVDRFVEKPDRATAEGYLADGGYFWNSGIFLLGARAYLQELGRWRKDILDACEAAFASASPDLDFLRLDAERFATCPAQSVDYAVMEHTRRAAMMPLACGWSDLGDWSSLQDNTGSEADGNVLMGDVLAEDTRNSYIRAEGRLVATVGVSDHIVVETPDAVLVAARDRCQDVRRIVDRLREMGRDETDVHRRVYRPWGSYEGVATAERFQAKRIIVDPGQRLSLQMHHHRAEHWIVVRGTARVTRDGEQFLLGEDQSTYIPLGVSHCLENPGVIPLEVIEVQTGSYLGEDDIVRFDDIYGRVEQTETEQPAAEAEGRRAVTA